MEIVQINTQKTKDLMESFENYQDFLKDISTQNVVLYGALEDGVLLAMGALEVFKNYGEIKHVVVAKAHQRKGLGKMILAALENYLVEQSIKYAKLAIGILQYEALGLYRKLGYKECHAFGTHRPDSDSVFMSKAFR